MTAIIKLYLLLCIASFLVGLSYPTPKFWSNRGAHSRHGHRHKYLRLYR